MRIRTTLWCLAVALLAARRDAGAQAPHPATAAAATTHTLTGTVADPDGNPVVNTEVALLEHDRPARYVRSDSNGHFSLTGLTSLAIRVRFRRLGFQAQTMDVHLQPGAAPSTLFVHLQPHAAVLDGMSVEEDSSGSYDLRLRGFHERERTNSFGHYIDEAAFARSRPQFVSDAMRHIPGVVVKPTKRLGNTVRIRGCGVAGESPEANGPLVWVDGVRMAGAELDEVAQGADVAAVEIYNGFAGIPAQFFDRSAVCGTILVWTRSR